MEPHFPLFMMLCASHCPWDCSISALKASSDRFGVRPALKAGRQIHAHHANSACQEGTSRPDPADDGTGQHLNWCARSNVSCISLPLSAIGPKQSAKLSRRSIGSEPEPIWLLQGTTSTVTLPTTWTTTAAKRRQTVSISLAGRVRSRNKGKRLCSRPGC